MTEEELVFIDLFENHGWKHDDTRPNKVRDIDSAFLRFRRFKMLPDVIIADLYIDGDEFWVTCRGGGYGYIAFEGHLGDPDSIINLRSRLSNPHFGDYEHELRS